MFTVNLLLFPEPSRYLPTKQQRHPIASFTSTKLESTKTSTILHPIALALTGVVNAL